jgi:hypothetical protein
VSEHLEHLEYGKSGSISLKGYRNVEDALARLEWEYHNLLRQRREALKGNMEADGVEPEFIEAMSRLQHGDDDRWINGTLPQVREILIKATT